MTTSAVPMSSTEAKPLVSIGLPTHNGARSLAEALDCLLEQDYPNFEILISDNASTDQTEAIAIAYAARDRRVRLIRQATNIGAAENFNRVVRETTGPLFMWAADDDRWEPGYVSACVAALQAHPTVVLACTRLDFLGESLNEAYERRFDLFDNPDLSSRSVRSRMRDLMSRYGWYAIYGVIRRDVLQGTRLFTEGYGADVVLLTELALRGPFVLVEEVLFHYRVVEVRDPDRGPWDGVSDRVRAAPYSHLQERCAAAIAGSGLPIRVRLAGWLGMTRAAFVDHTPLRDWIGREVHLRLVTALAERDFRSIAKYGIIALHRKVDGLLRRAP